MQKNHYATLGVSPTSSQEQIKQAFKKLATEHHPDKKGGSHKKFQEINEAYEILGDVEKRKEYDEALNKAPVTDLKATVSQVVGEYFEQFKSTDQP